MVDKPERGEIRLMQGAVDIAANAIAHWNNGSLEDRQGPVDHEPASPLVSGHRRIFAILLVYARSMAKQTCERLVHHVAPRLNDQSPKPLMIWIHPGHDLPLDKKTISTETRFLDAQ